MVPTRSAIKRLCGDCQEVTHTRVEEVQSGERKSQKSSSACLTVKGHHYLTDIGSYHKRDTVVTEE